MRTAEGRAFVMDLQDVARVEVAPRESLKRPESSPQPEMPAEMEARARARELALRISPEARRQLFAEQGRLAMAEALGDISKAERIKLQKIRWHIDRIQDAEAGPGLDMLERMAEAQRAMAEKISRFAREVREVAGPKKAR